MERPQWLKTKKEKRFESQIRLAVACFGFGVAIREYQDKKEKEDLEIENLRLENEKLRKQLKEK